MSQEINVESVLYPKGFGNIILNYRDGSNEIKKIREDISFANAVVNGGREAMVRGLANQFGGVFNNWVYQIAFGSGGTVGGVPRYVEATRSGLFGSIVATKPVISTINPSYPSQVTFTSVLLFDVAIGDTINEMGLILHDGTYYSITTFGDISKTSSLQLTVNWVQNFL